MAVLPKKGDITYPKNFRAIMVGELDGKLYQCIINNRLTILYEQMAPEHSNGFRPGRGTTDSLFILLQTLRKRKEHNKDSWVLLLDAIKAFDGVPRTYLWATMQKAGVDAHMLACLKDMYKNTTAVMQVDGVKKDIDIKEGTGQGSVLGPKLFAFFMLMVLEVVEKETAGEATGLKYKIDGVMTGRKHGEEGEDVTTYLFGFADDTAAIFDSREDLEKGANKIITIFEKMGLKVHTGTPETPESKTAAMYIPAQPEKGVKGSVTLARTTANVDIDKGKRITPMTGEYVYLGYLLQ
jgi:hypothetical protein